MRKQVTGSQRAEENVSASGWLNLTELASVEVTSENAARPIEGAFAENLNGWLAGEPGKQVIKLQFDAPVSIRQVQLQFTEERVARTQEFTLGWLPAADPAVIELRRQQWTFHPPGNTTEKEDLQLDLKNCSALLLTITPDISRSGAYAELTRWRVR